MWSNVGKQRKCCNAFLSLMSFCYIIIDLPSEYMSKYFYYSFYCVYINYLTKLLVTWQV